MLLLSMHCIEYAFRKLGCFNVYSHGNSVLLPDPSLVDDAVIP
jgi:hypothetical protein